MKVNCKGCLPEIIHLRLFRGVTYVGKLAENVNHTQLSISGGSAQLQWVHPTVTCPYSDTRHFWYNPI